MILAYHRSLTAGAAERCQEVAQAAPGVTTPLEHALEVAAAPDVRDQRGLTALYQRIGEPGGRIHSYDTRAAQNTGRRVKRELLG